MGWLAAAPEGGTGGQCSGGGEMGWELREGREKSEWIREEVERESGEGREEVR